MSQRDIDFREVLPAWVALTKGMRVPCGLSREQALERARQLRMLIREQTISAGELDDDSKSVLWAFCTLLEDKPAPDSGGRIDEAWRAYRFIESASWPDDELDEKPELLRRCAGIGLRALGQESAGASQPRVKPVRGMSEGSQPRRRHLSPDEGREAGERVLATPILERAGQTKELLLEEPSTILFLLAHLAGLMESAPSTARDEAEFLHWFIAKPKRKIGVLDERAYFLGESALLAAKACRALSRRDEMRRWLDRAEARFRRSAMHVEDLSRLAYERLVLYLEECRFDEVLELLPDLFETMIDCEMGEPAVKARFLEGLALRETGRLKEAVEVFGKICEWAPSLENGDNLLALAYVNLGQIHAALGEPERSLEMAQQAAPVFQRLNNLFGLAKLKWTVGDTLRVQRQLPAAIEAYREAQKEFADLGMRADVASLHLVVADLLLDLGQDRQAEWEVLAAVPVLEEQKMIPEGLAAYGLLRESVRRRQINREALRDLHGYFRHDR